MAIEHLLQGTTFNRSFPNDYLEIVKQLMRSLRVPVPRGMQAVTREALTQITDRVRRTYSREQRLRPPVYAQLIALVGGYAVRETAGRWHMHYNWAYRILEPWIETADGRFLPIFTIVFRCFCEDKDDEPDSVDILDLVRIQMNSFQETTPDEYD